MAAEYPQLLKSLGAIMEDAFLLNALLEDSPMPNDSNGTAFSIY